MKDIAVKSGPHHEEAAQWARLAQNWALVGQPMRPTPEDIACYERAIGRHVNRAEPRATMLGVTPEIALMAWPHGTRLTAVDQSRGMIERVWPRRDIAVMESTTIEADWADMPIADRSQDIVIGDGCYTAMPTEAAADRLLGELARILRPDGVLIQRIFVATGAAEPLEPIFADLAAGRFAHFQAFKLKLFVNIPRAADNTITLADIWGAWHTAGLDREALARRLGWAREIIDTVDGYRDNPGRYLFDPLLEATRRFSRYFEVIEQVVLDYPLAEHCPILICRAKATAALSPQR